MADDRWTELGRRWHHWQERGARWAGGAQGIARSTLGNGLATAEQISARRAICAACSQAAPCLGISANPACRCRSCGCFLHHKTRLAEEACPEGRWGPER